MLKQAIARWFILPLMVLLCLSGGGLLAQSPPNIVFLLSDDQAWTDYGFMGHPDIRTPNLDSLASRSLVFERGYVASPLCRPSLASMLTGLYPQQHGVTGNDVDGNNNRAALDVAVQQRFNALPTFVKALTDAGYATHQSGKWWQGSWQDGGFTEGMTHGDPKRGGRHGDAGLTIGRQGIAPVTDFIDRSVEKRQPFFLWFAPMMPHTPHNPPQRFLKNYADLDVGDDVKKYYAMCEWWDEVCGQLLRHLDTAGVADNTAIVYACDNGWAAPSTRADDPNQAAWKGYAMKSKSSPYENGIRTPIMISWPGHIEPQRSKDLAHAIDLFPTIAEIGNAQTPSNLSGINLLDESRRHDRDAVYGVTYSTHNMTPDDHRKTLQYLWVVSDRWKLIERHQGLDTTQYIVLHQWDIAPVHLYDLQADPHEQHDVAGEHPEVVERLQKMIDRWQTTISSSESMPTQE